MFFMGTQSNVMLLGVPAGVFQAVTLAHSMVSVLMWRRFVSHWSSISACRCGQVTLLLCEVMKCLAAVGSAGCPQWLCWIHHLGITTQ